MPNLVTLQKDRRNGWLCSSAQGSGLAKKLCIVILWALTSAMLILIVSLHELDVLDLS